MIPSADELSEVAYREDWMCAVTDERPIEQIGLKQQIDEISQRLCGSELRN